MTVVLAAVSITAGVLAVVVVLATLWLGGSVQKLERLGAWPAYRMKMLKRWPAAWWGRPYWGFTPSDLAEVIRRAGDDPRRRGELWVARGLQVSYGLWGLLLVALVLTAWFKV